MSFRCKQTLKSRGWYSEVDSEKREKAMARPHLSPRTARDAGLETPAVSAIVWEALARRITLIVGPPKNSFDVIAGNFNRRGEKILEYGTQTILSSACFRDDDSNGEGREILAVVWRPPPRGWVSLNTDAVFESDTHQGGMGYIVRDFQGIVQLAVSHSVMFLSAPVGEALTIKTALVDAIQQTYHATDPQEYHVI
ncbi:hypothetical protein NE237_028228 [Protea cynaroides]|uniref:RNase H type-1 domain-containing protein n=1 Tax=Protea cynaroides TaxID=273540 RepID=A0A9Q0GP03_9MAGN|nr:hypothetical protein NE237_028228 [Protea cynaroides]